MELKKIFKNNRGFSLIELLISSTVTLMIMGSIFTILIAYGKRSHDNQSSVRQVQESRFLTNILASDIKNAGAIISLANTGGFLRGNAYFTGVSSLNSATGPDGIIVASGEPDVVGTLTSSFTPSNDTISIESLQPSTGTPNAWTIGDFGIVIAKNGYYVFKVSAFSTGTITKRSQAVYYSGLLTDVLSDTLVGVTDKGNAITYPINAPVIKLANFSIYALKEEDDSDLRRKRRDLVRIVDTFGIANALTSNDTNIKRYVMASNIWDMQIAYYSYPDYPAVTNKKSFFVSGSSETVETFFPVMQSRLIREISIDIVALTDDYINNSSIGSFNISSLGDRAEYSLPKNASGKYKYYYKVYKMLIQPKNFGINI
jgi:hypothetical protein